MVKEEAPARPVLGSGSHSTMNIDILASAATEELKVLEKSNSHLQPDAPGLTPPTNSKSLPSLTDYFNPGKPPKFGFGPSTSLNNLQYLSNVALVSSKSNSYTTLSNSGKSPFNTLLSLQKMTPLTATAVHRPTPNRTHIMEDSDLDYVQQKLKKSRPNSPANNFTLPNSPVLGLSMSNTPIISANNSSTNLTSFFMTPVGSNANQNTAQNERSNVPPAIPRQMNHPSPPSNYENAPTSTAYPMEIDQLPPHSSTNLPPLRSLKLDLPQNLSMPNNATLNEKLKSMRRSVSTSSGTSGQFKKLLEEKGLVMDET